jgi:hypothetical protein
MSRKHYNIQVFRDAERHTQLCGLEPRSGVANHLPETEPDEWADEEKLSDQVSAGLNDGSDHCLDAVIHWEKVSETLHAKYTMGDPLASASCNWLRAVSPIIRRLGIGQLQ